MQMGFGMINTGCQHDRPNLPPLGSFETPPSVNRLRLGVREGAGPLATPYKHPQHQVSAGPSSLDLSRPALSFSLSLKLSPLMLSVIE